MGFSKYKRGSIYWCSFYDSERSQYARFSLGVKNAEAAQLKISELEKRWVLGEFNPFTDAIQMPLKAAAKNYLKEKKIEGLRPNTLYDYEKTLTMLGRGLSRNIALHAVSAANINTFLSQFKPATRAKHYRQLKAFFHFCFEKKLLKTNPLEQVKAPKQLQKLPKYARPAQFEIFFSVIENPQKRNLFETIALNGLRRNEANFLKWDSIEEDVFTVVNYDGFSTKSGREKTLPILPRQRQIFNEQWEFQKDNPTPYVFPNKTGKPTGGHTISQNFNYYRKKAGLPLGFNLKSLRHMAGYLLAKNNTPLSVSAQILGHTNLSTTEIYSQLVVEELRESMQTIQDALKK